MNGNSTRRVIVEAGDTQVVGHVGLHLLGQFADRLGVSDVLTSAFEWQGERGPVHARGTVLTHVMLMLAGGGEACTDIGYLAGQARLFGPVASASTVWRTFAQSDAATLERVQSRFASVRRDVWARSAATTGTGPVVLDIDGSLIEIHTESKTGTGPTYKGGYGFHPLFCFADATGEMLAAKLRPGNAGANTVTDHLDVLDTAIGQLPTRIIAGHRADDDHELVERPVIVRADSAGCTHGFVTGCRARNVGFAVAARQNPNIHRAISKILGKPDRWHTATRQDGLPRKGAQVAEITDLVALDDWPEGTRLIIRREPLHPGAQRSLFPSDAYRYWGHYTDQAGDPVILDQQMRAHAHVEDHIKRLKDSGLNRFPFADLAANEAWLCVAGMAADLVRWFQLLCCTGQLAIAAPKRLRWTLWHTPARIVRKAGCDIIRIIDGWPTSNDLLAAYQRINLII